MLSSRYVLVDMLFICCFSLLIIEPGRGGQRARLPELEEGRGWSGRPHLLLNTGAPDVLQVTSFSTDPIALARSLPVYAYNAYTAYLKVEVACYVPVCVSLCSSHAKCTGTSLTSPSQVTLSLVLNAMY